MPKLIRILTRVLIATASILTLAYCSLLLINLSDAEPSELTKQLRLTFESYPVSEDAENAFLIALASSALPESDALEVGIARRDWIVSLAPGFDAGDDPLLID